MDTEALQNFTTEGFESWLIRKKLSQRTIKEYLRYYGLLEDKDLNQISADEFLLNHNNQVARSFIKSLSVWQDVSINIPKITGRKSVKVLKTITREDVNRIAEQMTSLRNKLMLAITYQSGLRRSELLGIQPLDFRWDKWKEDKTKSGELIIRGKGNKERVVFLSSDLMEIAYTYVKALESYLTPESKIFPISYVRWHIILETASKKALGYRVNPHLLRHSCADYLYNVCKWRLEDIKDYLGHESIETTMIYAKINKKELKDKFSDSF